MTQHTPGPWFVNGNAISAKPNYFNIFIAQRTKICNGQWEANARLLAAAPDLLEALENAAEAFDIAINLTPTGPARNRLCDMNIQARAVLSKAKGEVQDAEQSPEDCLECQAYLDKGIAPACPKHWMER